MVDPHTLIKAALWGNKLREMAGKRLRDSLEAKRQQAGHDLADQIAVVLEERPGDTTAAVKELLEDTRPGDEDVLLEYFRSYMDALEPSAVPYIARLGALYFVNRSARDVFFRRVGRMLVDSTASEVEQLHVIFALAREAIGDGLVPGQWVRVSSYEEEKPPQSTALVANERNEGVRHTKPKQASLVEGIALLKRSLLVEADPNAWKVDFGGAGALTLPRLIRVFA